jgi:hypothetical protein
MCDYSLAQVRNRLAAEGEELIVHRFSTYSIGLASPADLANTPRLREDTRSVWQRIRNFFDPQSACPDCVAVCIPPGALLTVREIPVKLQRKWQVRQEEDVLFVQTSAEANQYRDAVSFQNGRQVSLQELVEGMPVKVISLGGDRITETEPVSMIPSQPPA